jgi:hypothetical protein
MLKIYLAPFPCTELSLGLIASKSASVIPMTAVKMGKEGELEHILLANMK